MTDTSGSRQLAAFCIILGAGALWVARDYDAGSVIAMGPGFFPRAISGLLILMGIVIFLLRGRDAEQVQEEPAHPLVIARIILCICGAVVLFGITLQPLGLALAVFLMVLLASGARRDAGIVGPVLTATALAALAVVLFVYLLGLSIPVLPRGLI
ncbi:tripartite tricarboxylate transporter TctB family protein [Paracoccus shanxieyensis]|nr:tripartite tricarboxylate transporter TctB family protein [Paracoccus shanxieyensis]